MKLALLGTICILSTYVGIYFSNLYKYRVDFFYEWANYIKYLSRQISFFKAPICTITEKYLLEEKKDKFSVVLETFIKYKDIKNLKNKKIKKEDQFILQDFFNQIGKFDYMNELNFLEIELQIIEEKWTQAQKEMKSKGSVYFKLGLIIGISLMVILA